MLNPYPETLSKEKMQIITDAFVEELKDISSFDPSSNNSLSYIQNPLPHKTLVMTNEIFQVIVIGGSFMKVATIEVIGHNFQIINKDKFNLPKLENQTILFEILEEYVNPDAKLICLNISFPGEAFVRDNRLDYKVIRGTKGHALQGIIGKNIGEELEKMIKDQFGKKIMVSCAHDITCLLMSYPHLAKENVMGGVIGTGVNFGFLAKNKKEIINLESGNFNKFFLTSTGKQVNNQSLHPNTQLFEKEVSGDYLCKHFNYYLKRYDLNSAPIEDSVALSTYAELNNDSDESNLAQILLTRSARFAACEIAGIYKFLGYQKLKAIVEGSLIWKGWNYLPALTQGLEELGISRSNLTFHQIQDSSILGCAHLSRKF